MSKGKITIIVAITSMVGILGFISIIGVLGFFSFSTNVSHGMSLVNYSEDSAGQTIEFNAESSSKDTLTQQIQLQSQNILTIQRLSSKGKITLIVRDNSGEIILEEPITKLGSFTFSASQGDGELEVIIPKGITEGIITIE